MPASSDPARLALDLAALGWHILPLSPASKRPLANCPACRPRHGQGAHFARACPCLATGDWCHGVRAATTDPARITTWWQRAPRAIPGAAAGPSGLVLVDRRRESHWTQLFVGGSSEFLRDGARYLDARTAFFYTANGVTPAMAAKSVVGQGSAYAVITVDANDRYFDGANTYRLHLPPDIPAKIFWSAIVYDTQTRSLLQTDQPGAGLSSEDPTVQTNPDGTTDVYFAPAAPTGHKVNWIQTLPGKRWFAFFRLYGPLQPWFDQTWTLPDIEVMH